MGMSLIASTGGVGLLPAYAQNFLPSSINQPSSEGRYFNCRSGSWLQKGEPVSHPQAFALKIGRVGHSRVQ